jgi:hypothetical protein
LTADEGFQLPRIDTAGGNRILRPGFIGNMLVGIIAAFVTWLLYDQIVDITLVGGKEKPVLSLAAGDIAGALLAGFAGGRLLTDRAEKLHFKAAAGEAATKPSDPQAAVQIMAASGSEALTKARQMPNS